MHELRKRANLSQVTTRAPYETLVFRGCVVGMMSGTKNDEISYADNISEISDDTTHIWYLLVSPTKILRFYTTSRMLPVIIVVERGRPATNPLCHACSHPHLFHFLSLLHFWLGTWRYFVQDPGESVAFKKDIRQQDTPAGEIRETMYRHIADEGTRTTVSPLNGGIITVPTFHHQYIHRPWHRGCGR